MPKEIASGKIKLYRTTDGIREPVQFTSYDNNNNSLIDYIEWIVPHLSNQTYDLIIEISKAEHLDENRTFISDIYESVKELDGNWSEEIPTEHYVRVTFKQKLDSSRDITIYPRITDGNPRIEIYEIDGTELIAEFSPINSNQYNTIYLTNLVGEQDVFDLKVVEGSIELEHIIDPAATCVAGVCNVTFTVVDSFIVPFGVTKITGLAIGGGGGGSQSTSAGGGGSGGDLRYSSAITVVPGANLSIIVGKGGAAASTPAFAGGASNISSLTSTLLIAAGGGGATDANPGANNGTSSTIFGVINGGNGGLGGNGSGNAGCGGGGGGGGWNGAGGNGGTVTPTAGAASTGAGGGGGGGSSTAAASACGGGGGGGIVKNFSVNKEIVSVSLKQGETKEQNIVIKNTGSYKLKINLQNTQLKDFLKISEESFELEAGKSKTITLNFSAGENVIPELYQGKLIIKTDGIEREILIVVEVESKKSLFDIKIEIPRKFLYVMPGKNISAKIILYNLGEIKNVDVDMHYVIKDENGNEIISEKETITVGEEEEFIKTFQLPRDIKFGNYVFYTKIVYQGETASASASFSVGEMPIKEFTNEYRNIILIVILVAILIILRRSKESNTRKNS